MDIYPQDLGPQVGADIYEQRQMFPADQRERAPSSQARTGWDVLTVVGGCAFVIGTASHHLGDALSFAACFVVIRLLMGLPARRGRRKLQSEPLVDPLMMHEVRHLQQTAKDGLSRAYLELVVTAVDTPSGPDVEVDRSVREALLALAEGIADLPPPTGHSGHDDPAALQAEAGKLTADADREQDAVIAASLRRRAEALTRQAEVAGRVALLVRRSEALRQEVAGQIAALQTSLTALKVGGSQGGYELASVAASIQQVAIEAGALTQARSEIGEIVGTVGA